MSWFQHTTSQPLFLLRQFGLSVMPRVSIAKDANAKGTRYCTMSPAPALFGIGAVSLKAVWRHRKASFHWPVASDPPLHPQLLELKRTFSPCSRRPASTPPFTSLRSRVFHISTHLHGLVPSIQSSTPFSNSTLASCTRPAHHTSSSLFSRQPSYTPRLRYTVQCLLIVDPHLLCPVSSSCLLSHSRKTIKGFECYCCLTTYLI